MPRLRGSALNRFPAIPAINVQSFDPRSPVPACQDPRKPAARSCLFPCLRVSVVGVWFPITCDDGDFGDHARSRGPGKPGFGFLEWSDSLNLPSSAIIK